MIGFLPRRASRALLGVAAMSVLSSACALRAQTAASASLPGAAKETDTTSLLSVARIARVVPAQRAAWESYLARNKAARQRDEQVINDELKALSRTTMTVAPFVSASFSFEKKLMTPAFFATDSARRMAENMLTFQTTSGGWSKHIDFTKGPRERGQSYFSENDKWQYIATVDNDATTSEIRFLAGANGVKREARLETSVAQGVRYLLNAQFPNGCWPQVWPLQGGYHDAATFNDNAIVEIMLLLDETSKGAFGYVSDSLRQESARAVSRAIGCVLEAQVSVDGAYTVWGQQHDPLTLAATSARSYELTSLTSKESASIVDFLMQHSDADARIPARVHAAIDWFNATRINGFRYEQAKGLVADHTATPLWARMSEIGTNKAIFSNRDGIKLYDYDKLTDRRTGYGWYADSPASTLKRYATWLKTHPRSERAGKTSDRDEARQK